MMFCVLRDTKISLSSLLSPFVCISEVVEHIGMETTRIYQGTRHEDNWMFYHDALSLMSAKETIRWMQERLPEMMDLTYGWTTPVG
jgi:hypothetical protein